MADDLLIRCVRPEGRAQADIRILGGRIVEIGPALGGEGMREYDGGGRLALPGLVEAHTHLDKTFWGLDWQPHASGPSIADKIAGERALRARLRLDPAAQSEKLALQAVAAGTTRIRTHVDVDTDQGLAALEGVLATRAKLRGTVDIDIVAFPQSGLLIRPGTRELLDAALAAGADAIGGIDPSAIERDPKGHLDAVFGLAQKHGKPVDIHLHEPDALGGFAMELIVERTKALGMQGKVTVGHAFCLGMADRDYARRLIADLARERIAVMTTGAASRPVPPLRECVEAGVVLCGGSDGVRDGWSPYGNADMLERAMLIALRNNCRKDDEIDMALAACTKAGAIATGAEGYGLAVGCRADLLLVPGAVPAEAVVTRPAARTTVKDGRIVAGA
jgi:cytosine/adenosine deaminase-related metal-dependent hydrolase